MRQEYKVAKTLMKSLKTELTGDLPAIAALLQSKGRGKDTVLAHITPKEAALLKKRGGRGSTNPDTGLLEFETEDNLGFSTYTQPDYSLSPGAFQSNVGLQVAPSAPGQNVPAEQFTSAADNYNILPSSKAEGLQMLPSTGIESQNLQLQQPINFDLTGQALPQTQKLPGVGQAGATGLPTGLAPTYGASTYSRPDFGPGGALPQPAPGTSLTNLPSAGTGATTPDKTLLQSLGLSGGQALGAGLSSLIGINTARNAAAQGQQAKQELAAQAAPYQQQGKSLVSAAQAGQLSTASQQSYQAAQAQAAQAAARGGISGAGVVQAQAALENLRQNLLANDLNIGLQIQSIGDKIAQGAISAGVQADQYVNNLTSNYATNIARTLSGLGGTPQAPTAPTGV